MADAVVRLRVEGRVQGVGFRWYIREAARRLGVSGTVRNLADGGVEIAASGSTEALAALEAAAAEGPPGAAVSAVHRETMAGTAGLPHPFAVLR